MSPTPAIICTLSRTGEVQMHMPGPNGMLRAVPIESVESIRRALVAQLMEPLIGQDGAPTIHQVQHWEEHSHRKIRTKLRSNCPFCINEARHEQAQIELQRSGIETPLSPTQTELIHRFDSHGRAKSKQAKNPTLTMQDII